MLDRLALIEGSFLPEGGEPFTVETILTGDSLADRQALVNLARKRVPTGKMKLASQRIYTRSRDTAPSYPAGVTMGQLFGESGSGTESGIEVGEVFFQSQKCQVVLRNLRARNAVTVSLRPPGGSAIVFSNQVASNRLAKELFTVVKEILGQDARELKITIKIQE